MSQRHAKSGTTDNALTTPGSAVYSLLANQGGNDITTNRQFWLKGVWAYNSHASEDAVVDIWDDADAAAGAAAQERFTFIVPPGTTAVVPFEGAGLGPFTDNCCAGVTNGTIGAYHAGCWGYEIGG